MLTAAQIIEDTRALLLNRPYTLSLPKIAEETGLSESWLSKFGRGEIENPRVETLFKLKDYLEKKKS